MTEQAGTLSAVVVAGGQGRRLGLDKATLCLADGTPLLQMIAARLAEVAAEIIVVAGTPARRDHVRALHRWSEAHSGAGATSPAVLWLADDARFTGNGPLAGLYTGLNTARGTGVVVVGCDMPYLDPRALRALVALFGSNDIVVPVVGGHYQPLHALYRRDTCLPVVEGALREGRRALRDLTTAAGLQVAALEVRDAPDASGLPPWWQSVNTPAEMYAAGLRPLRD